MIKARKKIRTIIREMFLQSISIQRYSLLSKHSKIHYSETEVGTEELSKFLVVDAKIQSEEARFGSARVLRHPVAL